MSLRAADSLPKCLEMSAHVFWLSLSFQHVGPHAGLPQRWRQLNSAQEGHVLPSTRPWSPSPAEKGPGAFLQHTINFHYRALPPQLDPVLTAWSFTCVQKADGGQHAAEILQTSSKQTSQRCRCSSVLQDFPPPPSSAPFCSFYHFVFQVNCIYICTHIYMNCFYLG